MLPSSCENPKNCLAATLCITISGQDVETWKKKTFVPKGLVWTSLISPLNEILALFWDILLHICTESVTKCLLCLGLGFHCLNIYARHTACHSSRVRERSGRIFVIGHNRRQFCSVLRMFALIRLCLCCLFCRAGIHANSQNVSAYFLYHQVVVFFFVRKGTVLAYLDALFRI